MILLIYKVFIVNNPTKYQIKSSILQTKITSCKVARIGQIDSYTRLNTQVAIKMERNLLVLQLQVSN